METLEQRQREALEKVLAILEKYKHSPRFEELNSELLAAGYTLQNRRVIWSGGVGSWRVMRGGIVRVLCRASTWGYKPAKRKTEGHWVQVGAEYGYKYGLCVEITPEGYNYNGMYYHAGFHRGGKHPKEFKVKRRKIVAIG